MKLKYKCALLLVTVILLCSCSVTNRDVPDEIDGGIRTEYNNLDALGKKLYIEFDKGFKENKYVFTFPVELIEDQKYPIKVFRSYLFDHPEAFILSGYATYRQYTYRHNYSNTEIYEYSFKMVMSYAEYKNMMAQLEERVDEIVTEAEKLPTDYDKAKYVHDVIIMSCSYDDESADFVSNMSDENPFEYNPSEDNPFISASTAYGCLVEGKAICSGYTEAYQLVMQRLGITCGKINGKANGGNHIWNWILLDENYYYVDVTWDDSEYIEEPQYSYFCISEDVLSITHDEIGRDFHYFIPVCDSMDKNPIAMKGMHFENYDFNSVAAAINDSYNGEESIELSFADSKECTNAINDLFFKKRITEISALNDLRVLPHFFKRSIYISIK